MSLYLGVLSGTSMDGIDVALLDASQNQTLHVATYPFTKKMRHTLNEIITQATPLSASEWAQLDRALGIEFAEACNRFMHEYAIQRSDVQAIGLHGQTLCHSPFNAIPYTFQAGCAHTVSVCTKLPTVSDFRRRDIALGGQGAPLAPIFHNTLFQQRNECIAVINIGGVANISLLDKNGAYCGFDTGPGNVLMDAWIKRYQNKAYDNKGYWGASGRCIPELLDKCCTVMPMGRRAPVSFDKSQFSLSHIEAFIAEGYAREDVQATFAQLTAVSIAQAVCAHHRAINKVFICGGGAENLFLQEILAKQLPDSEVQTTRAVGLNPLFVEAHMFAWFAYMRITRNRFDLSSITGAKAEQYLGILYE